jgi:hypothetical protein
MSRRSTLAPPEEPKANNTQASGCSVLCVAVVTIAVVATAALSAWLTRDVWLEPTGTQVVVLDPEVILTAGLVDSERSEPGFAEDFSRRMNETLARFAAQGVLVISTEAVATFPPRLDVTEQFGRAMELDLEAARDYMRQVNMGKVPPLEK